MGTKRQRVSGNLQDKRKLKRQKRLKFEHYYRGTFYGKSVSSVMYNLCSNLNRDSKDMLWYWIVGMTDLIVHNKCGTYDYDEDMEKCNDEVTRLNPHIYNKRDEL